MIQIAFDTEIAKELAEGWSGDIFQFSPLGITCAGLAWQNKFEHVSHVKQMSKKQCQNLVDWLLNLQRTGLILTWNGCSFDFHLLAEESGLHEECVELALNHCDMMLLATCSKGWRVKLDYALRAHGLKSKQHEVKLNDGSIYDEMGGAKAPELWRRGEYNAVLTYLKRDCNSLLELADDITIKHEMRFYSKSGNMTTIPMRKLFTVRECMQWAWPDQSWMTDPPKPKDFWGWMKRD